LTDCLHSIESHFHLLVLQEKNTDAISIYSDLNHNKAKNLSLSELFISNRVNVIIGKTIFRSYCNRRLASP